MRTYVKDSAKYLNMNQLNALLAENGLGKSCEYSVETLWDRKCELGEKHAEAQYDDYMAQLHAEASFYEAQAQKVKDLIQLAIDTVKANRARFVKFCNSGKVGRYFAQKSFNIMKFIAKGIFSLIKEWFFGFLKGLGDFLTAILAAFVYLFGFVALAAIAAIFISLVMFFMGGV